MSQTLTSPAEQARVSDAASESLAALRAELDALDDALHDLLMRRAEVVARVAAVKNGAVALRPGREAAIARRLLARHSGPLAPQAIVRIWREMLAGMTAIQGRFAISAADTEPDGPNSLLAREHFGALTALRQHRSAPQAIADVAAGRTSAAVLPIPTEGEPPAAAWWRGLLHRDDPRLYIVARLPFWSPRPEGAPRGQAFVASAVPPDPSEADRSLIGLEAPADLSRTRLIAGVKEAGFEPGQVLIHRHPGAAEVDVLIDVAGFVTEADPRLAAVRPLVERPVVLGAYAVPVGETPAAGAP
jgi:chorismate mutase/prephenate dehydratase